MDQIVSTAGLRDPGAEQPIRISWSQPKGLFGLSVVNFVLRILTLGIYNFWGKTEVRKRIWSAVRLNGEPLHYTGTGKELFLGFLIIFGVLVIPIMLGSVAVAVAFGAESTAFDLFQLAIYVGLFFLTGIAIYRAQRYRLSRTLWRGIRGGMESNSQRYAWTYFWTGALIPLTAGWIMPWRSTKLQGMLVRDMRFGDRPFAFTAPSAPLYARFAVLWVLGTAIAVVTGFAMYSLFMADFAAFDPSLGQEFRLKGPTIGAMFGVGLAAYLAYSIVGSWYRAAQINHFARHTHFDRASFDSRVTAGGLIWIGVTNLLIIVGTLGLLIPIAQARAARYLVERLELKGGVNLEEIMQTPDAGIRRGEGLAQAFDVDAF